MMYFGRTIRRIVIRLSRDELLLTHDLQMFSILRTVGGFSGGAKNNLFYILAEFTLKFTLQLVMILTLLHQCYLSFEPKLMEYYPSFWACKFQLVG